MLDWLVLFQVPPPRCACLQPGCLLHMLLKKSRAYYVTAALYLARSPEVPAQQIHMQAVLCPKPQSLKAPVISSLAKGQGHNALHGR